MYGLRLNYKVSSWADGASPGAGNLTQWSGGYIEYSGVDTNPPGTDEITNFQIRVGSTAGANVLVPQASTTHASHTAFTVATTLTSTQIASLNTVGNASLDWFFGISFSSANPNLSVAVATLVLYTGVAPGPKERPCGMSVGANPDLLGNLPVGGGLSPGPGGPCLDQPGCQGPVECGFYSMPDAGRRPIQPPAPCSMRISLGLGR